MKPTCMRRSPWRANTSARWWPPTMCASSIPRSLRRTRPGSASARAAPWMIPAAPAVTPTSSTCAPRRRWRNCSPTYPRPWTIRWRSPGAVTWCWNWVSPTCRTTRYRRAWASMTSSGSSPTRVWSGAWQCCWTPPPPTLPSARRATASAWTSNWTPSCRWASRVIS